MFISSSSDLKGMFWESGCVQAAGCHQGPAREWSSLSHETLRRLRALGAVERGRQNESGRWIREKRWWWWRRWPGIQKWLYVVISQCCLLFWGRVKTRISTAIKYPNWHTRWNTRIYNLILVELWKSRIGFFSIFACEITKTPFCRVHSLKVHPTKKG